MCLTDELLCESHHLHHQEDHTEPFSIKVLSRVRSRYRSLSWLCCIYAECDGRVCRYLLLTFSFANSYAGTDHRMNNTWRQRRWQHDCTVNEKKAYSCHGERRRRINYCIERRAQCCIAVRGSRKRWRTQGRRTKKMEKTRERRIWEEKNTKTEEYSIGNIGIRHQHRRRALALSIVICIRFSASVSKMSRHEHEH